MFKFFSEASIPSTAHMVETRGLPCSPIRVSTAILVIALGLGQSACGWRETPEERHKEANTPAGKLGQAAHKAAVEANKAGRVIGRQLDKAAHDVHEGWKEAERNDKNRK